MMVLFNLLQQAISVELHMILMFKQFPLQLGEASAATDLPFSTSTLSIKSLLLQ